MKKIDYRIASIDDAEKIFEIDNSYMFEKYSLKQISDFFNIDYYRVIVACESSKIVGYICFSVIYDECNLIKIVVDKNYRKLSIGKNLVDYMKSICKELDVNTIYLEVREDNNGAISFYEKLGFQLKNVRPNYYGDINAKIYEYKI